MLLLPRILGFISVTLLYLLLGWMNWDLGSRVALLGLVALVGISAWTTRNGGETKAAKILVVLSAACFFAMFSFHAFLRDFFGMQPDDANVMGALFGSDKSEASEFIQQNVRPLAKHIAITLLVAGSFACLVWWKPPTKARPDVASKPARGRALAFACAIAFLLLHLSPTWRTQNPILFFPLRYLAWQRQVKSFSQLQAKMAKTAKDSSLASVHRADDEPRTVVFVLGESVTRSNFSITGYPRKTTPELDSMGDELTWFPDVVSADPSTGPSISKILTPATIKDPDLWLTKPDLLLMAKKAGYKTFWLSNQSTDANGHISIFASHADVTILANKGGSRGEGSYDEIVLPLLEAALRDPEPRKFIILHLLNGHPAYYYRYPKSFAKFNDVDDEVTKHLKAAGRAVWAINMRNCYDNAILYTDHVLKQSLDICRSSGQRLAWIFVPDHGQDAAHNTNFSGHNARALTQYEILMIYWRSQSFPAPTVDRAALSGRPYQTDVLDHTLLGLLNISGDYYDPRADIFSENFQPAARSLRGKPYP